MNPVLHSFSPRLSSGLVRFGWVSIASVDRRSEASATTAWCFKAAFPTQLFLYHAFVSWRVYKQK